MMLTAINNKWRIDAIDPNLLLVWHTAGYKDYLQEDAASSLKFADGFLQKTIYRDGAKLFFITIYVYIKDDARWLQHCGPTVSLMPEVQFNAHTDEQPTINVTYFYTNETPEELESFFLRMYDTMQFHPYGE